MPRITCLLFSLAFAIISSYAQRNVPYKGQDYSTLSTRLQAYYDSLASIGYIAPFNEGGDYAKFRKWNEFWGPRLKPGDTYEDYFRSYATCLGPGQTRSGNMGDWHELGPSDLPSGTAPLASSGYGIGPIRFLTINVDEPDRMLCGAHRGGLFYTDDAGLNWRNGGSDAWDVSGCQAAVFSADDPDIWYAANYGFNGGYWGYNGAIRRTFDQGNSWETIADHSTFQHGGVWTKVNKLVADHTDGNILFAATEHQLWQTENVNAPTPTWSALSIPVPSSVLNDAVFGAYNYSDQREVYDLEMHPNNHDILFATVCFYGELSPTERVRFWRIMRSFDGGASWDEMPNRPPHAFWVESEPQDIGPPILTYRNARTITLENTKSDGNVLYALFDLQNNNNDQLWMIMDAVSGSWGQSPLADNLFIEHGAGNGFGVSQHDPNVVFVSRGIRYRVFDNGTPINYSNNYLQYHVDIEDFVSHPSAANIGEVWMANHGGVHRSTDNGATWEWRGKGLAVAEVHRMATSYSEPQHMILGLYHDGNVLSDGLLENEWQPQWKQLGGLDGQVPLIDPIQGNWMFWSSQEGNWRRSGDRGTTSVAVNAGAQDWDTEGTMDHKQPNVIHIAAWPNTTANPEEVRRSMNRGDQGTFETISDFNTIMGSGNANIWRIYPAWSDPEVLYVHFNTGQRLFKTFIARGVAQEIRNSWIELEHPRPDMWISDIGFDHENPNICYISYSSGAMDQNTTEGIGMLFRVDYSEPGATVVEDLTGSNNTWTPLPNTGVGLNSFALERGSDGGMYLATDVGVYYTNNKFIADGTGWKLLGGNLPHIVCRRLEINYVANKVRVGTYGRGVWEHDLWCPDELEANESGVYVDNRFLEVLGSITSEAIVPVGLEVSYRGGVEVRLSPGFRAEAGSQFHAFIHPCNSPGNSFKALPVQEESAWEESDESPKRHSNVTVFPNLTMGEFSVRLPAGVAVHHIRAFDPSGREVLMQCRNQVQVPQCSFSSGTPPGTYLLALEYVDGSTQYTKIALLP